MPRVTRPPAPTRGASTAALRPRLAVRLLMPAAAAAATLSACALVPSSAPAAAPKDACPEGRRTLDVVAAPEIAPVLARAAGPGAGRILSGDAACLDVLVDARPAADVAAALRTGSAELPADAWVSDSSLRSADVGRAEAEVLGSVASSPVVLAVAWAAAEQRGWPQGPVGLAAPGPDGSSLRLAVPDPQGSAAARVGLVQLSRSLGQGPQVRLALSAALRTVDRPAAADTDALLDEIAELDDIAGRGNLAAPVAEQSIWARAAAAGTADVVAAYPPSSAALDYPLVDLTSDAGRRADVELLLQQLGGTAWRSRVQAAGFRGADGMPGDVLTADRGVDGSAAAGAGAPSVAEAQTAVRAFAAIGRPMRMLAVIDVSGSMARAVPGAPGQDRLTVAAAAAAQGLGLLGDSAHVGLWTFATRLTGSSDHRALVPLGPLGVREDGTVGRELLGSALAGVRVLPEGDTGLYDTTLSAVRAVREQWDPERVNSVVLLTDGRNDDADGIGLDSLLERLRAEEGDRPVPVIAIAYGSEGDVAALRQIAAATTGSAHVSQDPRQIGQVLQSALAQRTCRPNC